MNRIEVQNRAKLPEKKRGQAPTKAINERIDPPLRGRQNGANHGKGRR